MRVHAAVAIIAPVLALILLPLSLSSFHHDPGNVCVAPALPPACLPAPDIANFTLRCGVCQIGLKGEKEAVEHAKATGHTNFSGARALCLCVRVCMLCVLLRSRALLEGDMHGCRAHTHHHRPASSCHACLPACLQSIEMEAQAAGRSACVLDGDGAAAKCGPTRLRTPAVWAWLSSDQQPAQDWQSCDEKLV